MAKLLPNSSMSYYEDEAIVGLRAVQGLSRTGQLEAFKNH
jgi:hypothetical protein